MVKVDSIPQTPSLMSQPPSAFLVARRDDGFGDVYPLHLGTRYKLGRAPTNKVLLKDDLCSREHAEVFPDTDGWFVRDLGSLNGTHVNGEALRRERSLRPLDEVRVGRTRLVFVDELAQLPDMPKATGEQERAGRWTGNPQAARADALPAAHARR